MKISFKNRLILLLSFIVQYSLAQKKEENIETEVVNVVKPYTPTISDAFKVKEIPVQVDLENSSKEVVKYSIFSFPVASTFTPSKGKAEGVEKEKQVHLFSNYASFGLGNYGNLNADVYVNHQFGASDYFSGMLRHFSSQGGIESVELNDSFYNTVLDLTYGVRETSLNWNVDFGFQNQIYNWYGLPTDFGSTLTTTDRANLIQRINPEHSYNTIYLGGKFSLDDNVFTQATAKFNRFSDSYGAENRFFLEPNFDFNINDYSIKTKLILDYLAGSFEEKDLNAQNINYGFANFGIAPSFALQDEDWTFDIGAALFYSLDIEKKESSFLIYPRLQASLKVVSDLMVFYAGAVGNLRQNSYSDLVNENPYLSPFLEINPTNKQYDIFAGLKGKLTQTMSYTVRASFESSKNSALFKSNDYTENPTNAPFEFGNSLKIVYDDLKTISFYGNLKTDISKSISLDLEGTFSSFTTKHQAEAWNLPNLQFNAKINYTITDKWFSGANLFFVGNRKDQKINTSILYVVAPSSVTLESYLDVNAYLGFKYNERWTAFLKANNLLNQNYQKWLHYPVQGFQVVFGASYKFDF